MSPTLVSAIDKHVGPWRLSKDVLGSGTTSTVVLASRTKLPTLRAAVKVISRSGLLIKAEVDPTAVHLADAVIQREVLLMKLAVHERIVRLYDFVGSGDLAYIVMEQAPHKTLLDLFRACPSYVSPSLVAHIFYQLMQGLAHTHGLHIVHRDLKLENIFLFGPDAKTLLHEKGTPDFSTLSIKIGDFGLAHVDDPHRLSTVFHGSPHYQAPEVWARLPHHPLPTDIWSAGAVLYALLCRSLPFHLADLEAIAAPSSESENEEERAARASMLTLSEDGDKYMTYEVPEFLPAAADKLLSRMFAINPSARPTAREILHDAFFDGVSSPCENQVSTYDANEVTRDSSVDLYDLATLCVSPGGHIPRETFLGSALERSVKERLVSLEGGEIERTWAKKMSAYAAGKESWETAVQQKILEKERKERTRSLGRKFKVPEVLGQKEINLTVPRPRLTASLSLRSLRLKAASKDTQDAPSARPTSPSSSSVTWTLEDRREALLRRAYELGFGTGDLRAFADEAGRIVRVAKEGMGRMGLEEIAKEVERRGACDVPKTPSPDRLTPTVTSAYASAATTLVAENVSECVSAKPKLLDVPVLKIVALEKEFSDAMSARCFDT